MFSGTYLNVTLKQWNKHNRKFLKKGITVLNKNLTLGVYSTHDWLVYKALCDKHLLTQLKSSFTSVVALGIGGGGWKNLPEVF